MTGETTSPPVCVISDTSALSALARMDWLDWLLRRWGRVTVPEEVWHELKKIGDPAAWSRLEDARNVGWLEVVTAPADRRLEFDRLHAGKIAAISLALARRADWLIVDDGDARRVAESLGLRIIGVLGLMVWAKRHRHLQDMAISIAELQKRTGFRVSPKLASQILSDCERIGDG